MLAAACPRNRRFQAVSSPTLRDGTTTPLPSGTYGFGRAWGGRPYQAHMLAVSSVAVAAANDTILRLLRAVPT
eukprot:4778421-Prymnesium_polylepis.1